jgi:hypothetical protein
MSGIPDIGKLTAFCGLLGVVLEDLLGRRLRRALQGLTTC